MLENNIVAVKVRSEVSSLFSVTLEAKQGYVLPSWLFIELAIFIWAIFIEFVLRDLIQAIIERWTVCNGMVELSQTYIICMI